MDTKKRKKKDVESIEDDPEILERKHFQRVVDAFLFYKTSSTRQIERKTKSLMSLRKDHQKMLGTLRDRLVSMSLAIDTNYAFIKNIIQFTNGMFVNSSLSNNTTVQDSHQPITGDDLDRVRTTIRQCVRDWAEEGSEEREKSYSPILNELDELFPADLFDRGSISVLVPGAGLGRLMYEIANKGFCCQGNEFSLYMLFASNYILNNCIRERCVTIHPWVHQTCNILSNDDQLREVKIPDVNPQNLNYKASFSMAAGDFLEVYTEKDSWDSVVMCFFLDTAHNVIDYIEKVYSILKPGGYWINFGPLLYHFADIPQESSIELTYEEIRNIITKEFKFILIKEKTNMKASYVCNPKSMLTMIYDCVFFVVQKPFVEEEEEEERTEEEEEDLK